MKVIFFKASHGGKVSAVIAWWTAPFKSKWNGEWKTGFSHVELLFSDEIMYSASQSSNSTRFKAYKPGSKWVVVEVGGINEVDAREFCESVEGREYDYAGVFGFVIGTRDHRSRWFCSEVVLAALQAGSGRYKNIDPGKVSPNGLYKLLKQ